MKTFLHAKELKQLAPALLILAVASAHGQSFTSNYAFVSLAGNFLGNGGWDINYRNMFLVSNNTWQVDLFVSATPSGSVNELKFKANGDWSTNWGDANQTNQVLPLNGIAELNPSAGNIRFTAPLDGIYRFTINTATRAYSIVEAPSTIYSNRVRNSSFEVEAYDEWHAYHWTANHPDNLAETFGNAGRSNWRRNTGAWQHWIGSGTESWQTFGGVWQDVPAGRGFIYDISGYFYADNEWTAANKELKVEFYAPDRSTQLGFQSIVLNDLTNIFQRYAFTTDPAPDGTAWARLVVFATETGTEGTLQFDDLAIIERPVKTQLFNRWPQSSTNIGHHRYGGWEIVSGNLSSDTNIAYSTYSARLQPEGVIQSPAFDQGIGRVTVLFRHGAFSENEDTLDPVSFVIETSPINTGGWVFNTNAAVRNTTSQFYDTFTFNFNQESHRYVRIRPSDGTNALMVGSVTVGDATGAGFDGTLYNMDFDIWNNATNSGCSTANGWTMCTGRVVEAEAYSLKSGLLDPPASNSFNALTSPLYPQGIGDLAFQFARYTNGSGPASFVLQTSTDAIQWVSIDTNNAVYSTSYASYQKTLDLTGPRYLRIQNIDLPDAGPVPTVFVNEGFNGGATAPAGWIFDAVTGTYGTDASSGEAPPSLKLDSSSDMVTLPEIAGTITNLTFWGKGQSIANVNKVIIEGRETGSENWIVLHEYTGISNSEATYSLNITAAVDRLRIKYQKTGNGNFALDDVRVSGITGGGGDQPTQGLLLDNITISAPAQFREQDFDTWPATTSYGEYEHQGWLARGRTFINSQYSYEGNALRLDNRTSAQPYIQSPVFSEEIGRATFKYRAWTAAKPVYAAVQVSSDGSSWTTIDSVAITNDTYQTWTDSVDRTGYYTFRIQVTSGVERAMIDEINVRRVSAAADLLIYGYGTDPVAPFTNDTVRFYARASQYYGAANVSGTVQYRIGTNGAFTASPLEVTGFQTYTSVSNIPPQPLGTVVQYYFEFTFDGSDSDVNSPKTFPENGAANPLFYAIPRAAPGQVWINEVNVAFFGGEFVELAGPAGFDLSGWSLEFYKRDEVAENTTLAKFDDKVIFPGQAQLSTNNGAFGFFLIGDDLLTPAPDVLFPSGYELSYPVGLRLRNESGGIEHDIAVDGILYTFGLAANDNDEWDVYGEGVSLVGTGTNVSAFTWSSDIPITPGAPNDGQTLGDAPAHMDPPMIMHMAIQNNTVQIITHGNTNAWNASPYYTTNLIVAAPQWLSITPAQNTLAGGTNTISFSAPAATNVFYHIKFTP